MACLCDNKLCEFHKPQQHYQLRQAFQGQMRVEIIRNGQRIILNRHLYTGPSDCKLLLCDHCHNAVQVSYGLKHEPGR